MIDLIMDDLIIPFRMIKDNWFQRTNNYLSFLSYSPMYSVRIETGKYILKTATKWSELKKLFFLRNEIFHDDCSIMDLDTFDYLCDHLAIIDKESGEICGTYRINTSLYSDELYSDSEFDLTDLKKNGEVILELGRACIHPAHRNGVVIDLLWKGIAKYSELTNARFILGCSSVYTTNYNEALALYIYLGKTDRLSHKYKISPKPEFSFSSIYMNHCDFKNDQYCDEDGAKQIMPSLLRSYFLAGAKVYGTPAIDLDFSCSDFLTILDIKEVSSSFRRRYFKYLKN